MWNVNVVQPMKILFPFEQILVENFCDKIGTHLEIGVNRLSHAICWFLYFNLDSFSQSAQQKKRGEKKWEKFFRVYWTDPYHKGEYEKDAIERRKVGGKIKGSREFS